MWQKLSDKDTRSIEIGVLTNVMDKMKGNEQQMAHLVNRVRSASGMDAGATPTQVQDGEQANDLGVATPQTPDFAVGDQEFQLGEVTDATRGLEGNKIKVSGGDTDDDEEVNIVLEGTRRGEILSNDS